MGVYSVDILISEARKLARDFRNATGKPLAGVSGEIAEYDAATLMNIEICNPRVAGYDAIGKGSREGKRIQIKGRAIFDESKSGHRIGQLKIDQEWDSIMLVLMDDNFETFEIYEANRDVIEENMKSSDRKKNKRGAMSVNKFKAIGELVWSSEKNESKKS